MTTNKAQMSPLENYLNQMWHDYCHMNPEAFAIYNLFTQSGEIVQNDHIALRTFNHPKLGIKSLAQHFLKYGYHEAGEYFFTEKKLYAKHYENTNPEMPKVGLVGKMIKYACYGLLLLIVAFVCKNYVFSLFNDDGQFVPKLVELKANDPSKLK